MHSWREDIFSVEFCGGISLDRPHIVEDLPVNNIQLGEHDDNSQLVCFSIFYPFLKLEHFCHCSPEPKKLGESPPAGFVVETGIGFLMDDRSLGNQVQVKLVVVQKISIVNPVHPSGHRGETFQRNSVRFWYLGVGGSEAEQALFHDSDVAGGRGQKTGEQDPGSDFC